MTTINTITICFKKGPSFYKDVFSEYVLKMLCRYVYYNGQCLPLKNCVAKLNMEKDL